MAGEGGVPDLQQTRYVVRLASSVVTAVVVGLRSVVAVSSRDQVNGGP